MVLSWVLRNCNSRNFSSRVPIQEYLMSINILGWLSVVRFLMVSMLWVMEDIKLQSSLRIMMCLLVVVHLPIVCHSIWMHIPSITKSDLLDRLRYSLPGMKMKVMGYICYSHQGHITDIHAAQQARADRTQKPSSKKQISVS